MDRQSQAQEALGGLRKEIEAFEATGRVGDKAPEALVLAAQRVAQPLVSMAETNGMAGLSHHEDRARQYYRLRELLSGKLWEITLASPGSRVPPSDTPWVCIRFADASTSLWQFLYFAVAGQTHP